jgi:tRNA uridine 5-carboxymethylaminomethyl modification enzyme
MYGGYIQGIGPRYCPSIEDKMVRFADKPYHQLFLEPESLSLNTIYLQGFSTSMPRDVQDLMIKSLPGFANSIVSKYAYAIEYDAIDPMSLSLSLESKIIANLFFAGQINGTSGYEEAAGQGLIAGINASLKLDNKPPLILKRSESYIGVMIDDIVNKGASDPYRLLTSRAEYRLFLRHDNADERLLPKAYNLKLIKEERYQKFLIKLEQKKELIEILKQRTIKSDFKFTELTTGINAFDLVKRPFIKLQDIVNYLNLTFTSEVIESVEIEIKYEGYLRRQEVEIKKFLLTETTLIPEDLDYHQISHLSLEARVKLSKVRPASIGQASRIGGINQTDMTAILIYLKQRGSNDL